jgi:signal transduction histidine kinase/CheY-like chemotaxis protein
MVLLSAGALDYLISSKINTLLKEHLIQSKHETDYLLKTNGGQIESYVYENSFWDDFYNATKKIDTGWINENMTSSLQHTNYGAEFIMITNADATTIYKATVKNNFDTKFLHAIPSDFTDSLKSKHFLHCVVPVNNEYIEVFAAPTQLSSDVTRTSKPVGYLICGRRLNEQYFNNLKRTNSQITYAISPETDNHDEQTNLSEATITYFKKIPFYNNRQLYIKASVFQPEIKAYSKFVLLAFVFFISIIVACSLTFFVIFIKNVVNPLSSISKALTKNESTEIEHLTTKQNEFGEVACLITSYFEATEKLEDEIEQRKASEEALQRALKVKSEFLSNMSHEIRTPINGVIGISNLLLAENLTPQQLEYAKVLHHSSNNLLSVVSDILDVSKLESDNFKLEEKPFNLFEGCEKVYQLFKPKADEKGLNFVFLPDSTSHSQMIMGDEFRLGQILNNLVSNAIKFTKHGSVEFSYKTIKTDDKQATYEFLIKDSGIGMDENDLESIFDSFSQANTTINRKYGGTGLGLSISKKIIERMGGEINVKSAYKVGSSFSVILTFTKHIEAIHEVKQEPTLSNQNLNKMRVLIAEDNNMNVFILNQFLKKWGADVTVVENGKLALDKLQEEHYDIVLMDYHMPVMNGLEATTEIRKSEDEAIRNTPVFALTADVTSGTKQMLLNNGFNQYVSKPFAPEVLYDLLFKYKNVH